MDLCRREGSALASLTARVESLERQLAAGTAPTHVVLASTATPAQPAQFTQVEQAVQKSAGQQAAPAAKAVPPHLLYTGPEEQFEEPDEGVPSADELAQLSAAPPVAVQTVQRTVADAATTPRVAAIVAPTTSKVAPEPVPLAPARASTATTVKALAKATSSTAAATIEEFGGDYAAGEDFWQQTLELVRSEKKMSMHSCAKSGRVYSFANDLLVVAFKSAFQSQRMQKPDFREYFESVLLRVARRPIRLQCEAETELKKHTGAKPKAAAPQVQQAVEPKGQALAPNELPENLQRAMNALGGIITKVN